jgi:hypothetical protein
MNTAFGTPPASSSMPLPARARSQARHAPRVLRHAFLELAFPPDTAVAHTSIETQLLLALPHGSLRSGLSTRRALTAASRLLVHLHPYAHDSSLVKPVLIRFLMPRYTSLAL